MKESNQQIVKRVAKYFLTGTILFLIINYLGIRMSDTPHELRNEFMAFYLGPIVMIGKIIYFLTGGCEGTGKEIYILLSGPNAVQLGNYAPSTFGKIFTAIIGISWSTLIVYLLYKIQLPQKYNSPHIKIPLLIIAIIILLTILYWLNGGNNYYTSLCAP